ncbi:MAG TPA: FtsQ-type POTRA domain-containing protein [Nitrolancea sp.]|jgi:cell division protein FtsQ|nr:FtsQ-type POTRA domain-containing protein [Nitrolancea sp.]
MRARRKPAQFTHTPERRKRRSSRFSVLLRSGSFNGRLPAFLLSVGLSVLVFGFLFSGDFPVRVVVVEGNNVAYADSIVGLSGAMGQSIFTLNTQQIAQRVAAHPAVASANVKAEFPDTVVVHVTERIPVLAWHTDKQVALVDERGDVIALSDDSALPKIVQVSGDAPSPGTRVDSGIVQAALYVTKTLGPTLSTLNYDPSNGLTAQLADGRTVVLGSGDEIPLKISVLQAVLKQPYQWTKLDVRQPDRPYYQ